MVSQGLQNVNLKTCADLYSLLAAHLNESRNEFEDLNKLQKK